MYPFLEPNGTKRSTLLIGDLRRLAIFSNLGLIVPPVARSCQAFEQFRFLLKHNFLTNRFTLKHKFSKRT